MKRAVSKAKKRNDKRKCKINAENKKEQDSYMVPKLLQLPTSSAGSSGPRAF